ncbi:helix-turn-helix transcriptional regulator [Terrabacter terrae]|uniref:helix-turn-helix domain-containing protein n=1 Tax=Terrabacter terrae TaxID=318434 RepID=UPI0031DCDAB4
MHHNNLRAWRTASGLTLHEVSDLTGLSRSYLCRLEQNERTAPPFTKVKIARSLGVSISALFPRRDVGGERR